MFPDELEPTYTPLILQGNGRMITEKDNHSIKRVSLDQEAKTFFEYCTINPDDNEKTDKAPSLGEFLKDL